MIFSQGNFLSWHRYYTWAYEQALRNECGYNGTQPVILLSSISDLTYSDYVTVLGLGTLF